MTNLVAELRGGWGDANGVCLRAAGELERLQRKVELLQKSRDAYHEAYWALKNGHAAEPGVGDPIRTLFIPAPVADCPCSACDALKRMRPQSFSEPAPRETCSDEIKRPSDPPATSRYCVDCDRIKDDSGQTFGWALCHCGSFRLPAVKSSVQHE